MKGLLGLKTQLKTTQDFFYWNITEIIKSLIKNTVETFPIILVLKTQEVLS